jgi:hypothetical protein
MCCTLGFHAVAVVLGASFEACFDIVIARFTNDMQS